ncbi:unnamed protein product [Ixodes persulcatus]
MESPSEALSVDDVYTLAEEIGKEFEIVIDNHGVEAVKKLMTKVICVLEYLEAYAFKNDTAREEIVRLKAQIYQLEHDKSEKAQSRNKLEKEMEQYEDVWRQEMKDLGSLVARLQEENSKLSTSLKARDGFPPVPSEPQSECRRPHVLELDDLVLKQLRDAYEKQTTELRKCEKDLVQKTADLDMVQRQLEAARKSVAEQGRRSRRLQVQVRQLCEEQGDLQAQLQDAHGQLTLLQQRLGTAVKDNYDLLESRDGLSSVDMRGKVLVDLDDPQRPRFTLDELKNILFERNELKAKVSDLEDELALYRPRWWTYQATSVSSRPAQQASHHSPDDDDLPVQGPINQEPEEKLFSLGRASGIRKFFQLLLRGQLPPSGEGPFPELLPNFSVFQAPFGHA